MEGKLGYLPQHEIRLSSKLVFFSSDRVYPMQMFFTSFIWTWSCLKERIIQWWVACRFTWLLFRASFVFQDLVFPLWNILENCFSGQGQTNVFWRGLQWYYGIFPDIILLLLYLLCKEKASSKVGHCGRLLRWLPFTSAVLLLRPCSRMEGSGDSWSLWRKDKDYPAAMSIHGALSSHDGRPGLL